MKKIDDHFMQIDGELLLRGVDNSFDFNDRILQAIATVDDLIIVTNDSDFSAGPFDTRIITGNKRLLGYYIKP
jgi:predicted nuclease of predicted toxin-antitoxin system